MLAHLCICIYVPFSKSGTLYIYTMNDRVAVLPPEKISPPYTLFQLGFHSHTVCSL